MPIGNQKNRHFLMRDYEKQGLGLLKRADYEGASKIFSKILQLDSTHANAYFLLAYSLKQSGKIEQSKIMKQAAYKLNAACLLYSEPQQKIVEVFDDISKKAEKIEASLKVLTKFKSSIWDEYSQLYRKKLDFQSAVSVFRLAEIGYGLEDVKQSYFFTQYAIVLFERGLYEEALRVYLTAIRISSNQFRYYNNSSIIAYCNKDYQKSLDLLSEALQRRPNYGKSFYIMSYSKEKLGQAQEAFTLINRAIASGANVLLYQYRKFCLLVEYQEGQLAEINKSLENAIRIINSDLDTDRTLLKPSNQKFLVNFTKFMIFYLAKPKKHFDQVKIVVRLFSDYLIKGSHDRALIQKKIEANLQKMTMVLESEKGEVEKNADSNPELELLEEKKEIPAGQRGTSEVQSVSHVEQVDPVPSVPSEQREEEVSQIIPASQ